MHNFFVLLSYGPKKEKQQIDCDGTYQVPCHH
jgi:hypothetical protein